MTHQRVGNHIFTQILCWHGSLRACVHLGCSGMASERVAPDVLQQRLKNAVKANDIDEAKKCIDGGTHPDTICDRPRKVSALGNLNNLPRTN